MDHVIHPIHYQQGSMFQMASICDNTVWAFLLISTIAMIVISLFLLTTKTTFSNVVWFYFTSFFHPVEFIKLKKQKWLVVMWGLILLVLTNFFSGELFTVLTTEPKAILIDSWSDLAIQENVPIIAGADVIFSYNLLSDDIEDRKYVARKYIIEDSIYYKNFVERLNLFSMIDFLFPKNRTQIFDKVLTNVALLWEESKSYFYISQNKTLREKLHISRSGGDVQPMFQSTIPEAEYHFMLVKNM